MASVKLSFQQLSDFQRSVKQLYIMSPLYICIRFSMIVKSVIYLHHSNRYSRSTMEPMEETWNFSNIVQSRAYYRILHCICPRIHPCTCMMLLRQKHSVAKPTSENAGGGGLISIGGCLAKRLLFSKMTLGQNLGGTMIL